jgi:hypothetical protein
MIAGVIMSISLIGFIIWLVFSILFTFAISIKTDTLLKNPDNPPLLSNVSGRVQWRTYMIMSASVAVLSIFLWFVFGSPWVIIGTIISLISGAFLYVSLVDLRKFMAIYKNMLLNGENAEHQSDNK